MINTQSGIIPKQKQNSEIPHLVSNLGKKTQLPTKDRNYTLYNTQLVQELCLKREHALPHIDNFLKQTREEKQICEAIYTLDRMCDAGVKGIDKMYPTLAKFNHTSSPNIQVLLAGVYRKTQVPDAFGPLCNMLIKNSQKEPCTLFDAQEEIGGAILEYIKVYSAKGTYEKLQKNN